jgi:hypothetical protein
MIREESKTNVVNKSSYFEVKGNGYSPQYSSRISKKNSIAKMLVEMESLNDT